MQAILSGCSNSFRPRTKGMWVGLLIVLTLCLGTFVATAQNAPPIVVTQSTRLLDFASGGWGGGASPVGGSYAIDPTGNVLVGDTWGGNIWRINAHTGANTAIVTGYNNVAPLTVDQYGNLYIGQTYGSGIVKLPYNAATDTYAAYPSGGPAASAVCTGNTGANADTAACNFALNIADTTGYFGVAALAFDPSGNFWVAVNQWPGSTSNGQNINNSLLMCDQTCQYAAQYSAAPVTVYTDSVATDALGGFGFDPWGNLFFADAAVNESGPGAGGTVTTSGVYELPYNSSTKTYASTPTQVVSYTNAQSYSNGIYGVAVDASGTIYFATPADGIYGIPNTQAGGPSAAHLYQVSPVGGKGVIVDSLGNLYQVAYANNHDGITRVTVGNAAFAPSPIGTADPASTLTVVDNVSDCTNPPTITATPMTAGTVSSEFATSVGSTCSSSTGGIVAASNFPVTVTFTPANVGERSAVITATDTTNKQSGTATATGVGQGVLANLDPGALTGINSGLASPTSVVADAAGDIFVADSTAGKVFEVTAGSTTLTSIGSGFSTPSALALDGNANLFIADSGAPGIFEIPNTSAAGGFTAGKQVQLVNSSTNFGGTALAAPAGIAVGPDGVLYISDITNARVVTFNPVNGVGAVTGATAANGLKSPAGVAVDAAGTLYVADDSLNEVFVFATGTVSTVAPSAVKEAVGVAVEPSGSLLIADKATGSIVRVQGVSGVFDAAHAIVIEKNPMSAQSVSLDAAGDLFTADSAGKAVYAIQRTAAAINIGTVQDGLTNTGTVYLMNAGNQTATLGTPVITQASNTMFTLAAAATDGCADGITGPAGAVCMLTATFAPPPATPDGAQTGTASINFSPSGTASVTMTGTASISSVQAQAITGFAPPPAILVGQQIAVTATGGGSGNPVVFTIDGSSSCKTCAIIVGNTLAATSPGAIIIDANQAGGTNQGVQYAAAPQVQATITINTASPAGVPGLIMTQQNWLGALPNGGAFAGDDPAGTSLAVNAAGQVLFNTSYGNSIGIYDPKTGAISKLGAAWGNQTGGVAIDPSGNLYASALYNAIVVKIPFINGHYVTPTDPTGTAPANCTGTDTTECTVAALSNWNVNGGVSSMTFDSNGNLFVATDDQGGTPFAIYECNAACLNTGTAPVLLFQEPKGSAPATTGQLYIGSIAVDPWGNVFFTDSNFINQSGSFSNKSTYSDLYELPTSSGAGFGGVTTGYAAAPTLLQTFTNTNPGGYDDEIDGVAVTSSGTVYYAYQYDGVYGIPNTKTGGPDMTHQFAISGQGAKVIGLDSTGNIYLESYNNGGDALGQILVGDVVTPIAQLQGAPVTASATVVDNVFGCGTAATMAIVASDPQFSATAGTTCSGISISSGNGTVTSPVTAASSYAATISFAAVKGGAQNATLTMTDTTNGGIGTASVTGVGQETPQTITFTAPITTTATFAPGLTITLGATGGGSNNPIVFTMDAASTGAGTISGNMLTVTQAGNIVVDANQAGGLVNGVYYDNATQAQLPLTISKAAQAITFAAQGAPATYAPGLTITLTATGGASTSPVIFSVDASSTGAGTVSGSVLTVTQAGNIVIDANQATDVNYLDAPQVQQTFVVNQGSQTITFIPLTQALHYIMGGLQVQISATGGATNNPIVFSVDAKSPVAGTFSQSTVSGSTSTATLTIKDQSALANFPANVLIDATQPGNANYADATPGSETVALLKPLPTQAITFTNPGTQVVGTPFPLGATSTSGFPVSYISNTTTVCTVDNSSATATFIANGTCTITATQPGDNLYFAAALSVTQTFYVNPTGQAPSLTMGLSLSSLTVQAGTVGLTQVTVNSLNNFTGPVTFSCSGAPSGYNCSFNPASVSAFTADPNTGLPLGTTGSSQLSISGGSSAAVAHPGSKPILPAATLAIALCLLGFKKRNRLQLMLLLVIAAAGLGLFSGCGGSSSTTKTKTSTTQITVTATAGKTTQSQTLTLIVE